MILADCGYSVDLIRDSRTLSVYEGVIGVEGIKLVRMISAVNKENETSIVIYYFRNEEEAAKAYEALKQSAPYAYRLEGTRVVKDDTEKLIN